VLYFDWLVSASRQKERLMDGLLLVRRGRLESKFFAEFFGVVVSGVNSKKIFANHILPEISSRARLAY